MIKITNITLKNFLSVGNATQAIKLDSHGLTLVLGSNTDANGATSRNGAGKTTILQAISFGLYGKPLTKIKVGNLINNVNGKGMLVTVEFERDGVTYRVERGQKPSIMRFYVDGTEMGDDEDDQAQGENKHTQEEINRLIGMSHTMFKHIVALNTFTEPFLKLSAADQRAIIEELLGVTQISQRAEALKKLIAQTKEDIRDYEAAIKATTEANARIETAIKQTEANSALWIRKHNDELAALQAEIEALTSIDFDAEIAAFDALDLYLQKEQEFRINLDVAKKEVSRLAREIKGYEAEASRYRNDALSLDPEAQIKRLNDEIARKERDAKRYDDVVAQLERGISQAQSDMENADHNCSSCGQRLTEEHHKMMCERIEVTIQGLTKKKDEEAAMAAEIRSEILPIMKEIETVEFTVENRKKELLAKAEEAEARAGDLLESLGEYDAKVQEAEESIAALGERPETIFRSRDEVYKTKALHDTLARDLEQEIAKVNPYEVQVESLKATLQKIDYDPLNELQNLFKHQDFLYKLLTSKDSFVRKRIIDQNLAYLNSRLNMYLDKLGLPHEVKFLSDLSVEITLLGRDFDFEQLSRGEMNRVIMATSWSFRDVWESLNVSLNLLWVDELIDSGMDDQGSEAALEILKKMTRDRGMNVFLISHKDNLVSRVSRILMVHKDNSFTRFEEDAQL